MVYRHMRDVSYSAAVIRAALFTADNQGNMGGFLIRGGLSELAVGAVHIPVVAEIENMGMLHQARFVEAVHDTAYVFVNIFHHSIVAG